VIHLVYVSVIKHDTTLSRDIPVINEPDLQTDDSKKDHDTESDDSKSSSSTELCDEPDRLSDFDSEEPTSISETSSQVLSTGEGNVTKLTVPSTANKSGPTTPELILENDLSLPKPSKYTIILSESKEVFLLDSKSSLTTQSGKLTDKSSKRVTESSLMEQPLLLLEECEIKPSKQMEEVLLCEELMKVSATSPGFAPDDTESSVNKESFEITSQTEASPSIDTVSGLKLLSLKEIPVYEKTQDIYFSVADNTDKLSISEYSSEATSSRESSPGTELDHSKHSSSEKPGSAIKIDVSDILKRSSPTEEHSLVSSELLTHFQASELKTETTEKRNSDEISLKGNENSCYCFEVIKPVDYITEYSDMVESDTHFTEQPVTQQSTSEVMQPEEKTEMATSNISTELKSVKVTDYCMRKSALILEITQESHQDTFKSLQSPNIEAVQCVHNKQGISPTSLQCGDFSPTAPSRLLQDDICSTTDRNDGTNKELNSEIGIYIEKPRLEINRSRVAFSDVTTYDTVNDAEQLNTLHESESKEDKSACMDVSEGVSKLLELNQGLQDQEQVLRTRNQACEVGNLVDRGENDIDYTEMSELLETDQNINLGRRNSKRALKIIQENSEILQRILQCQERRPSKLSEEESSDGTTTIPSEADSNQPSIPTSTSPENVDVISCQQLQAESEVPKRDPRDSCILAFVSPKKDGVSVGLPNEVPLSSPIPTHSFPESEVFSDHPQAEKEMSIELQSLQCEKEEHIIISTTENCDNHCYSSARNLMLPKETSVKRDPIFSLASGILKPKPVTDNITQVPHHSDEQFQSQSEDRTISNIFAHSSYPLSDNVYHVDSRACRNTELELDIENCSSKIQSSWKRFSGMDSNLSESISSKFPKCFSPEATNCNSHSSYASKDGKENLQFLESPAKVVTETKALISVKQTDVYHDDDFTTDKHFITERASNDSQSHTDTSFSKPSRDLPSSSSWYFENSKLKIDSSPTKSATDSHNLLSHPGSDSSTFSAGLSISKPYASISRHEYSPTKSRNSADESNTDYFEHNSSKHREVISPWHTKESVTCPTLKSSSDTTEITPVINYPQNSSCSSNKRFTEDFQYSSHSSATSDFEFSSGTRDAVHRTTRSNHNRPHSPVITDVTPTEILNRSFSSSCIDGHHRRTSPDLSSPPASPDQGHSLFKSVHDESSSLAPEKTKSSMYDPIPRHEMDSPMPVLASDQYRHSFKSSRRNDSESKFSIKDLSPMGHSSFSQSRWEGDNMSHSSSSPINSENRSEQSDSQTFPTEYSLVNASLSAAKVHNSPTVSPTKSKDIHVSLPPIKTSSIGSPTKSRSKFDPFPPRPTMRQPKELGIKLGLYSTECANKNGKIATKKT
jgi:hypothetical protein